MGSNCCKCANDKKNKNLTSASSNSSGPWSRGDVELVGDRFSSVTQRGAVTLNVRNATVGDSGRYSLSVRNDAGHAHSDLLLEVRTRPGDVPVFLRRLNDLAVKVGTRTRFLVEIRSPTQVKVSWEQEGKPVVESERFHLLHEGNFFCVDVAPVTLEDAGLWICRAHNSNGTATCFCHLNVLVPKAYKAPHFIEELMAILTEQGTVSLECKVVGVPTPTLRWFKDNQEIKAGDVFALSADPQDTASLGTYTCEATNCMGRAYSTSRVHVVGTEGGVRPVESIVPKGPAPVFSKELRNEKVKIGGKLTLSCKVSVPPWPKSIAWFNKEGTVESGGRYHVIEDGLGAYSIEVDPVEAGDEGEWKCVATSDHGVKGISTCNVSVSYPKNYKKPKFLESLKAILTEEGLVSFECKVVGYPTPQLRWFKDGQELKPGDVYQLTGTNSLGSYCCIARNCMGETSSTAELTVEDIQSQLNEEERLQLFSKSSYCCIARNCMGETSSTAELTVEDIQSQLNEEERLQLFSKNQPPRFLQGLKSLEAKIMDPLRLTVQVSMSPQPSVAWYRDDEEVKESERYKKEQETKGFCHLTIKRLELMDQAEWKCVATNDYGQSVTSCFLKLSVPRHYKKPRFLENLRAVLSEEGAVNLECKVIGVPQPTLKWYKDGRELKPGDIHRIISGQDGTCCLGTYTCEATNCMGTVASSASLLGFEDKAQVKPQPEPRPLPPVAALARHPSLSTILEERTSQLHDTVASDERAEVSFSFDGKEVSVSLYETPDLTEEEALQVVEMYAEELSEHISGLQEVKSLEHNVVELPPMRFVKETSQSGHLLMEAVVIDVSPEYYTSAEDRTEADLDEFSITEDNGFMSPQVLTPEEMPFEKFTADFLERTVKQKDVPVKPPRKRGADNSESSYHSMKEAKLSPEEETSEFADALSSIKDKSQRDSFGSAKSGGEGSEGKETSRKEMELESRKLDILSQQENNDKFSEKRKSRKKSRSRSRSAEIQSIDSGDAASEKKGSKRPLKKRKSSESEKEDDSLREFEKQKSLNAEKDQGNKLDQLPQQGNIRKGKSSESEKEDDSLQEFESRKSFNKSGKEGEIKSKVQQKKHTSDSSGREDDSLVEYEKKKVSSDGAVSEKSSLKSDKQDRQKAPLSKSISTDSSEKDEAYALKSDQSEQSRKRKKRSIKKSGSTEKKTDTPETGVEIPASSEAESCDRDSLKNKKVVSTSDLERMRSTSDLDSIGDKSRAQEEEERSVDFDTAEDSAYDKSEMSVLESLTHSIKEIKKGLAAVEERVISESTDEPQTAKSSLSVIESLVQPINEIQRGLVKVEKLAEETEAGQYSPSSILETLKEPIQELGRNLAEIEKAKSAKKNEDESLLKRTSQTLLETMSQPLQELQKELTFIQQQAVIETGEETYSDVLQSFKPSLLVVQGGVEQTEGDFTSKIEDLTDITVLPQGTYAQQTEQTPRSVDEMRDHQIFDVKDSDIFLPSTVQDLEESLAETGYTQSLNTLGALDLNGELEVFSVKLDKCHRVLNQNSEKTNDDEVRDILKSLGKLITPLDQFKNVIEKCLKLVTENEKSNDPQIRSSNMVLKATLESPVHALGKCLSLLEVVANSKSNKEIRGLGIKILYKLSFPLEELKTTMKLIENLSEHTSIELLLTPVENLISAASVINLEASKSGFAENIPEEGGFILTELVDTVGVLSTLVASMTKDLPSQNSLKTLSSLIKPLVDFQKNLLKIVNKIKTQETYNTVTTSEIYNLAQDLCKPLQAIRTELSIAQHEIELDQYSHLSLSSDIVQDNTLEYATNIIHQSLEQVHKSVLTCTEFVLSKSPSETLYVRYLLFALNELILPINQLNTSISKSTEIISKELKKLPEPNLGIMAVTSSTSELLNVLSELRQHTTSSVGHPEFQMVQLLSTIEEPLLQVERELCKIVEHTHDEDKNTLNINMLKTLAEPFKLLQKSIINIYEKLESESVSQGMFLELRQPIQELQRNILVIQDQVSFEYGDEPASIESNIVTLQSLVNPLNVLKKQFVELDSQIIDQTQSTTSYSKENKNLHSIIKANHELQLKISSIMVEENYVNKHSLDSLDMFPIFQDLTSMLRDFENALRRVDLVCQNEAKPDIIVHSKLFESVKTFTHEAADFQNKMLLASNKAIKDLKHPVHFLKKGTEVFIEKFIEITTDLENCPLDEQSLISGCLRCYQNVFLNFKEFSGFIKEFENFNEEIGKDSTEISLLSSSDTIKDVNTIMEEVTQTRVSLESATVILSKSTLLEKARKEVKAFCDLLKSTEDSIMDNTMSKANSFSFDREDERRTLINAFGSMIEQLHKIETYVIGNQEAMESVNYLKNTIEVIQEHLKYGEEISEVYILQNLSTPLKKFKDNVSKALDTISIKSEEMPSVSSYLDRFEKSASDLELGLMKLEHALLNSTGDFSSLKNIDIDVLAHPIEELVGYINSIEDPQSGFESLETVVDHSSLSMLKTLAQPIREIQEGVLQIQEQVAFESSGKPFSGKSCASILYEIAKPIRELRSGVALIQEQIVMEPDVEPLSEETRASSIQTFAAPIEEMKRVLTTITEQQPFIFEADVQSMSENISLLKTIAQPVKELQNKLASIEINQIMESGVEPLSLKENILALAKPVQTLQEGIAWIESQMTLETTGDDLSIQNSISVLKQIAKPLLEISKGIAVVSEQQLVEEGVLDDMVSVSEFSTLANITDVTLADAAVHVGETMALERGQSFQDDLRIPQVAKTAFEGNLQIGVTEQQQVLLEVDKQISDTQKDIVKYETMDPTNVTLVQEIMPSVQVQEHDTLSQANSFTLSEVKTPVLAELTEESKNVGVQGEFQDTLTNVEKLMIEKPIQETALVNNESLNIAIQVVAQETLALAKSITSNNDLQLTDIEQVTPTPFVVQGELQQSLADVESLETEEDTLESISLQDTSFKFEPHIHEIQQVLSNVEDLTLTEQTLCEADIKAGVNEAVQNEALQTFEKEANLESFDISSKQANLFLNTPNIAAESEIQQIVTNVDDMKNIRQSSDSANVGEVSLQRALQIECQQVLSDVESLKTELAPEKQSQALAIEESSSNIAIQMEVQEFLSVVEQIESVKNELKAKITQEPLIYETVKQEVLQVIEVAENIISLREEMKVKMIEEPNIKVELPDIKQALSPCEDVSPKDTQAIKSQEHPEIERDIQNILSLAKSLEITKESLSSDILNEIDGKVDKGVPLSVESSKTKEEMSELKPVDVPHPQRDSKAKVEQLPSGDSLSNKVIIADETLSSHLIETQLEEFITAVEDVSGTIKTFEAKLISDPGLKNAVQQEYQEMLCVVNDIKNIEAILQYPTKTEESLKLASQIEVQQVLLVCQGFEDLKEAIQAKQSKKLNIHSAIETELQQILTAADSFLTIKQTLAANLIEVEPLECRATVEVQEVSQPKETEKEEGKKRDIHLTDSEGKDTEGKDSATTELKVTEMFEIKKDEDNKASDIINTELESSKGQQITNVVDDDEKEKSKYSESHSGELAQKIKDGTELIVIKDKEFDEKTCDQDEKEVKLKSTDTDMKLKTKINDKKEDTMKSEVKHPGEIISNKEEENKEIKIVDEKQSLIKKLEEHKNEAETKPATEKQPSNKSELKQIEAETKPEEEKHLNTKEVKILEVGTGKAKQEKPLDEGKTINMEAKIKKADEELSGGKKEEKNIETDAKNIEEQPIDKKELKKSKTETQHTEEKQPYDKKDEIKSKAELKPAEEHEFSDSKEVLKIEDETRTAEEKLLVIKETQKVEEELPKDIKEIKESVSKPIKEKEQTLDKKEVKIKTETKKVEEEHSIDKKEVKKSEAETINVEEVKLLYKTEDSGMKSETKQAELEQSRDKKEMDKTGLKIGKAESEQLQSEEQPSTEEEVSKMEAGSKHLEVEQTKDKTKSKTSDSKIKKAEEEQDGKEIKKIEPEIEKDNNQLKDSREVDKKDAKVKKSEKEQPPHKKEVSKMEADTKNAEQSKDGKQVKKTDAKEEKVEIEHLESERKQHSPKREVSKMETETIEAEVKKSTDKKEAKMTEAEIYKAEETQTLDETKTKKVEEGQRKDQKEKKKDDLKYKKSEEENILPKKEVSKMEAETKPVEMEQLKDEKEAKGSETQNKKVEEEQPLDEKEKQIESKMKISDKQLKNQKEVKKNDEKVNKPEEELSSPKKEVLKMEAETKQAEMEELKDEKQAKKTEVKNEKVKSVHVDSEEKQPVTKKVESKMETQNIELEVELHKDEELQKTEAKIKEAEEKQPMDEKEVKDIKTQIKKVEEEQPKDKKEVKMNNIKDKKAGKEQHSPKKEVSKMEAEFKQAEVEPTKDKEVKKTDEIKKGEKKQPINEKEVKQIETEMKIFEEEQMQDPQEMNKNDLKDIKSEEKQPSHKKEVSKIEVETKQAKSEQPKDKKEEIKTAAKIGEKVEENQHLDEKEALKTEPDIKKNEEEHLEDQKKVNKNDARGKKSEEEQPSHTMEVSKMEAETKHTEVEQPKDKQEAKKTAAKSKKMEEDQHLDEKEVKKSEPETKKNEEEQLKDQKEVKKNYAEDKKSEEEEEQSSHEKESSTIAAETQQAEFKQSKDKKEAKKTESIIKKVEEKQPLDKKEINKIESKTVEEEVLKDQKEVKKSEAELKKAGKEQHSVKSDKKIESESKQKEDKVSKDEIEVRKTEIKTDNASDEKLTHETKLSKMEAETKQVEEIHRLEKEEIIESVSETKQAEIGPKQPSVKKEEKKRKSITKLAKEQQPEVKKEVINKETETKLLEENPILDKGIERGVQDEQKVVETKSLSPRETAKKKSIKEKEVKVGVEKKEKEAKKSSKKSEEPVIKKEESIFEAKDREVLDSSSKVTDKIFIKDKEENNHKLYLDESSTSDYGSESYSEPRQIKKSRSYDTRQWIDDSKSEKSEINVASKQIKESKYEFSSLADYEKVPHTRRQSASKPFFCGRLVDRTAAQGSKLKVTCSLMGAPDPTVQWFKDGHPVDTAVDHRIRTRLSNGLASLEIVEAKVGDTGKYTCTARNSHGEASTTANIKVFSYLESAPEAPVFTQHIRDHYKSGSDELVIECRVKGHPQPAVTWTKDGEPLRPLARYQQSLLTDGTCRLVIHGPEAADAGLYRCQAENAVWTEETAAYVTFEGREKYLAESRSLVDPKLPRFTNVLSDTVVREGGTVALQVAIKGTPRAEVTWYRGSEPLPKRSSRFRYLEDAGVYSLVMTEASAREAGTYVCRASNAHGYRDTSVNVQIVGSSAAGGQTRGKPAMFLSRPDTSMGIAVGEDVSVSFRVSGDPKPRVTWMKGMKDITNNVRTLKETVNDYVRLTLKHATVLDAGTYFIMAKNIYGADHAFVTVRVKQRARSLTPTRTTIWSGPDTSTILRDIHESTRALVNDVPGPVSSEPVVSDCGKNWLSLSWGKPEHRGAAPVLAYRVEAWLLGTEGGAQWSELGVTPINSFDVFFLKPGSEYKFRVTARNRYGWGESVTSTEPISVGSVANFPPDILRDLPGPLKALQGDNVTLECEISGDPPPTIQWLKDGQNVGTVPTLKGRVFVSDSQLVHRLIVKQLTEDDGGRYVCEAVNKLGRASTYARLLVVSDPRLLDADRKLKESLAEQQESAPQFTMRLRDRRVQASYPVRLSCQVVGSPTPAVTWAHQGQPITADDRHQIVPEADHFHTLEISRTLLEDSGEYTATASNCLGAVSCHCQLIVDKGIRAYISPEFTSELSPAVTVREGAELRLFAQVEAYPTVSISWQRDGVRLRPSRRLVMTLDPEGRVELALAHLTVRDAGLYTCSATNAVGRAETAGQVFVTGGTPAAAVPTITTSSAPYCKEPRFVTKPRSSEAVEGDTVVITCEVVGDPQPEVMWLRDWLKPGYYRDAPQFHQVGGGSQYSLEIPQVKLDFTGTYCVIARNAHGEAKAIISLQIYAKGQGKESSMVSGHVKHGQVETLPEIKRELRDVRCCDGDAVTLECLVTATPPPSVRWEKDGKILPLGEDIEAEVDGEIARLTIKKVYPEDEGQYSCVAYNDLGRAVTTACLVVDVPEEKETLLSQQLTRPPGLLSTRSTPRSTPRNTPSPARSLSPTPARYREFSSPSFSRPKRVKMSSPKFYTVPHNRIAEEGETVRFQCSVAGHPTPWASWDKDGHIVTPSARLSVTERDDVRTLELREVTVEDAGLYRVTLENEMGSVEATARLDIIGRQGSRTRSVRAWSAHRSSPTFGRRLVGSAARVNGTFTLTCDVHASPAPATSWYRNGELLVRSPRVIPSWDGRRARLELRSLQPEDAGVYTCVAENAVGTTQCSAELRVLQTTDPSDADLRPPVFLQGLAAEQTSAEGQPFELQVRLQGSAPLEVVWVKDGVEIPDCADFRHVDYGDGRFGLRIADVFVADAGIYNCEAFNDHGDAITSGHLIVNDMSGGEVGSTEPEIVFTKTPSPVLARLRGQASFCARLQSRPLSHTSFTWTVNGRSVNNDDRFKVTTEDDTTTILHIAEVRAGDVGPVVCTARVCCPAEPPTTVSCEAPLGLDPSPGAPASLLRGPSDTTVMRGDRVLLKATYRGEPEPNVRWLKAGRELSSEGRVQITSRDGVSCLTISSIEADDSGKYVVSVENIHGADCHFASVAVEGPPEAPAARPSVSLAGEGCVTVAWSSPPYDGGCVITGYRVEMRTAPAHQWSVVADRCHSLSHQVRGLTPGQTYVFRVRAENIHGASESSAESFPFTLQSPHADLRDEEGEGEGETEQDEVLEPRVVSLEPGDQFLERYSVHEELGKGRYGVVHKVTDLRTGQTMAAKFVRCIKKQDREKVQEEIDIMNCLRHPKLLQLTTAFENPKDMVMVMEYISGGELFERVVADDFTLTERDCILFLRQICEGVRYMHTCNVVHLDLKPENIMCHTRTSHRVKIIDFGLAQRLSSHTPVRVLFGTPEFIPPEIINYEPIGVESDMWSVGVICYVLLSGLSPFMGDNDAETFANITRADFDFDDEAFEAISQDAKDFISSLLVKRKEKRLTAEECLRHKWLTQSDTTMNSVKLCTDKLKKFIIRRKWQKTGNAIRALGRMATLSAASRRNSNASSPPSPRPSLSASRMSSLGEEKGDRARGRVCSERSDSGISDCSSINTSATPPTPRLLSNKYSICEEPEIDPGSCRLTEHGVTNKPSDSFNGKVASDVSAAAKKRTTNSLRLDSEPAKAPSPTLQKDAKLFGKSENFQKAFAFWKQ